MEDVDLSSLEAGDLVEAFADLNVVGPSEYLRRVIELDNVYNRQLVAKTFVETLKRAPDANEFRAVLELLGLFSRDPDLRVRVELVEQIPNIAIVCFHEGKLDDPVGMYLLPLLITTLTDTIPQVRKTAQAALLVLLENNYLKPDDIEHKIWLTVEELTMPDNIDDLRCEAVALMTKMAPLIGGDLTYRLIMNRFLDLCGDSLFHVRKVCAANFAKMCEVLPQEVVESKLLGKFFFLCEDELWGVRKACAESAADVSRLITPERRRTDLTMAFHNLLTDYSRWVRIAAYVNLGPFIATFADSNRTGLLASAGYISRTDNYAADVVCEECPSVITFRRQQQMQQQQQLLFETETRSASSESNTTSINANPDLGSGESISSLIPVSATIGDSEDGSSSKVVHIHVDNADNFNSFNYWRPPLPEMDMNVEIVEGKPRAIHVSARVTDSIGHRVYTSEIEVGLQKSYYEDIETCEQEETTQEKDSANHSDEDPPGDAKGDYASSPKKTNDATPVVTSALRVQMLDDSASDSSSNTSIPASSISIGDGTSVGITGRVRLSSSSSSVMSASQRSSDLFCANTMTQANASAAARECKQTMIPKSLFTAFLNMTDTDLAQTVDPEITRHCAFSFMAVSFTLGPKHWLCIRHLYETLSQDMQWKTRRSLAFSLHELATVIGEEATRRDLLPIFYELAQDVDEVKQGLVYNLSSFARHLSPPILRELLDKLSLVLAMENDRNWRHRADMAIELAAFVGLLSIEEARTYIFPILWDLLVDKVAEVRIGAFPLVISLVKKLQASSESSAAKDEAVLIFLREVTAHVGLSNSWMHRQTFVRLVFHILFDGSISDELTAHSLLPTLLTIGQEKITNLRISVARGIRELISRHHIFIWPDQPWYPQIKDLITLLEDDVDRDVRETIQLVYEEKS